MIEWGWRGYYSPGEFFYIRLIVGVLRFLCVWLPWTYWDAFIGWMLGSFVWDVWLVLIRSCFSFVNYLSLVSTIWIHKICYCLNSTIGQFYIIFTLRVMLLTGRCCTRSAISSSLSVSIVISTINIINAP